MWSSKRLWLAVVGGTVLAGLLSSCAMSGPAKLSTDEATSCAPASVGESFVVGDTLLVPAGEAPIVESITFEEATGVEFTAQAAVAPAGSGGVYLYSLEKIQDAIPEWADRIDLPSDEPIDTIAEPDYKGFDMQRANIVAIVERTGDRAGFLSRPRIVYSIGGTTYEATGTMTYWLNNGPCFDVHEGDGDFADTDAGRASENE